MKYTIIVSDVLFENVRFTTAFLFSNTIVSAGFKIISIFFNFNGVFNANKLIFSNFYENNLVNSWSNFGLKYNIPLCVCINDASKRGIFDLEQVEYNSFKEDNLAKGFKLTGLTELFFSIQQSDRVIKF
ncbi:Sulfurtransferase TusD [Buchnera aphidicola (Tetraneura ulmi)]|uniref:sulfurtransferase complex subunit TusD n=1 Tax=Buchnera aphidicola TaxID=9 RepID=UPI003463859D